jgi:hypothetical protein
MAVPNNTIQTMTRVGNREDLSDIIYAIDPTETPFVSAIGRTKASAVYTEWQTDKLADANADNKQVQGADLANENRAATKRMGNYTQIMTKVVGTSSTQRAVKSAGRADEHSYQMAKAGKEIKRDFEKRFAGNYAAVPPDDDTAGEAAGALAFITTNTSRANDGADPTLSGTTAGYPNAAATNGTTRVVTEDMLKTVIQSAWNEGGSPSMAIMGGLIKQKAASFSGLAESRRDTGNKKIRIIAGADVYVSDFGEVRFVPDRYCSTRDVLVVDPEYWSIATLDPLKRTPLAKTGLADREALYVEHTLRCHNERASGVVADVKAS